MGQPDADGSELKFERDISDSEVPNLVIGNGVPVRQSPLINRHGRRLDEHFQRLPTNYKEVLF